MKTSTRVGRSGTLAVFAVLMLSAVSLPVLSAEDSVYRVDHLGFTLWLDCNEHSPIRFRYNAQHDTGNYPRQDDFRFDPEVPPECQPFNTDSFHTDPPIPEYQRGHLVPANHLDYSEQALAESFYMTNILPQTATFNTGAWQATEEIVECYRDIDELLVIGGVVWGTDASNDYFIESHGIRTPDAYWKVIIRGSGKTIAWLIPNNAEATRGNLDQFLMTSKRLQRLTGARLPEVPKQWRSKRPKTSWKLPVGCDLG